MSTLLLTVEWFFVAWFALVALPPIWRNLRAIPRMRRTALRPLLRLPPPHRDFHPPVSLILPVHNAEGTIVSRVRLLLQLDYPQYELVVVNDGSTDRTLEVLIHAFELEAFPEAYWRRIPTRPLRAIYRSHTFNLRVIEKEQGGTADALNAGVNASRFPLFGAVDKESILLRDGLKVLVEPFLHDPGTVCSRAAARIANGCTFAAGKLQQVEVSTGIAARLQVLESLRTLLDGRIGRRVRDAALATSAATAIFRKDPVVEIRGYHANTIAPDTELLLRIERHLAGRGERCAVHFVADPVCWTQAPVTMRALREQRIERRMGLMEALMGNGARSDAAVLAYQGLGPVVELAGYVVMTALFALGQISGVLLAAFLLMVLALRLLEAVSGLLLDELSFRLYARPSHLARLLLAAMVDSLVFRPLSAAWRVTAVWRWLRRRPASRG